MYIQTWHGAPSSANRAPNPQPAVSTLNGSPVRSTTYRLQSHKSSFARLSLLIMNILGTQSSRRRAVGVINLDISAPFPLVLAYFPGSPLPYCTSPSGYRLTDRISNDLFFYGQWNPNECRCRQQCLRTLFTSSLESTTDKYSGGKGADRARVRIYYQVGRAPGR